MSIHSLTPTHAHTETYTVAHTYPPTPAHTRAPIPAHTATPTVEQLHQLAQQLHNENKSLKYQVAELTTRCDDLKSQLSNASSRLALVTAAPCDHHTNVRRDWHEQANSCQSHDH